MGGEEEEDGGGFADGMLLFLRISTGVKEKSESCGKGRREERREI